MSKGTTKWIQHRPRDRGWGGHRDPYISGGKGGRCPKICSRFGLKIEGKGPGPQAPPPWIRHWHNGSSWHNSPLYPKERGPALLCVIVWFHRLFFSFRKTSSLSLGERLVPSRIWWNLRHLWRQPSSVVICKTKTSPVYNNGWWSH